MLARLLYMVDRIIKTKKKQKKKIIILVLYFLHCMASELASPLTILSHTI